MKIANRRRPPFFTMCPEAEVTLDTRLNIIGPSLERHRGPARWRWLTGRWQSGALLLLFRRAAPVAAPPRRSTSRRAESWGSRRLRQQAPHACALQARQPRAAVGLPSSTALLSGDERESSLPSALQRARITSQPSITASCVATGSTARRPEAVGAAAPTTNMSLQRSSSSLPSSAAVSLGTASEGC